MTKKLGLSLMAIAVLHQLVGLFFYSNAIQDIIQAGFFNSIVPPYWERDAAFWFFMFGITLFLMGWIAQWIHQHTETIPRFFSGGLLILSIVGVLMMPASGFWLAIPVAVLMLRIPQESQHRVIVTS